MFEDPEIELILKKKAITYQNINYIITQYLEVVSQCREAKQNGIEIHKILKVHLIGDILKKHSIETFKIIPIFDDRIPNDFKVDAIDNLNLLYSVESQRNKGAAAPSNTNPPPNK